MSLPTRLAGQHRLSGCLTFTHGNGCHTRVGLPGNGQLDEPLPDRPSFARLNIERRQGLAGARPDDTLTKW